MRDRLRQEDGSGTLLVLAGIGALALVGLSLLLVISAMLVRTRAAAAADLAALAGASGVLSGAREACDRARVVAQANGARLRSCELRDAAVWVEVVAPVPDGLQRWVPESVELQARAHAELVPEEDR